MVWLIGLPLSFWICYRVSPFIRSVFTSPFLQAAVYVYFFLLTLIFTQVMFSYARWIWPLVEYVGSKSAATRHRALWATISLGLMVSVIYDVLKWLF